MIPSPTIRRLTLLIHVVVSVGWLGAAPSAPRAEDDASEIEGIGEASRSTANGEGG